MNDLNRGAHEIWASRWTFVLAATGSAVGLGNIWKFPYITGENGGGAFVLVYLVCIALVGIPVMISEVVMGKWGRSSPVHTMHKLVDEVGAPKWWHGIGWLGVVAGVIILSYYSVIAGWALHYFGQAISGQLQGIDGAGSSAMFDNLLARPGQLVFYHTLFMVMTMGVVIAGVTRGLGRAVTILMPVLLLLLIVLLFFSARVGDFGAAFTYLFAFDFSQLTGESILVAMGHAFFTLSIGMGAIMVYGAYMPEHAPIGKTVLLVAGMDTLVALLAGLAIFPLVFASPDIQPGTGPGLLFVSLPIAFGNMPAGLLFGMLFFLLVTLAAWSSSISLIEPAISWLVESGKGSRLQGGLVFGLFTWLLGLGTVFSFNLFSAPVVGKFNFFELADFLTSSLMLPLGGLLMALFAGWLMKTSLLREELDMDRDWVFFLWRNCLRYISPLLVIWVFLEGLSDVLGIGWLSLIELLS